MPENPPGDATPTDRALDRLAARLGVLPRYRSTGGEWVTCGDEARREVIAALGYDASSEAHARDALAAVERAAAAAVIEPVRVTTRAEIAGARLEVRLGESVRDRVHEVHWTLELESEDGSRRAEYGAATLGAGSSRFALPYPWTPPPGYHQLTLTAETGNRSWRGEQRWVVVPASSTPAAEKLGGRPAFGLCVNLYAVASERGWGIGDFTDLAELCRFAAAAGADFVALNPLHVLLPGDASPYAPSSRLFLNPLYLDVEAVPELRHDDATRAWLASAGGQLARLRAARLLDYGAVERLKLAALRRLHRVFRRRRQRGEDESRGRDYDAFRRLEGPVLDAFAAFQAMRALFAEAEGCDDWRSWPQPYRRPHGRAVRELAAQHRELVDFHRWLQFESDRQLGLAAAAARRAGMAVGLVRDLALGAAAGGFDAWYFADLHAPGVELGCPPDAFNPGGQSWGLPPLNPHAMRADGHRLWQRLLRHNLRHAGGLRLDHVLGLVRQLWIPAGAGGAGGAYVAQPAAELFGILALESRRAGALVVGEDLGTVPAGMDPLLARWQVLSTRVLYFTRRQDGTFPAASELPRRALLLATTHDLPSLAAWWSGDDLALRRALGLLADGAALRRARAARDDERRALLARLAAEGLLAAADEPPSFDDVAGAVHAFLARSPAPLVGVWLEDLLGESEPVNVPGAGAAQYPVWRRRLRRSLESLTADPAIAARLATARRQQGDGGLSRPASR